MEPSVRTLLSFCPYFVSPGSLRIWTKRSSTTRNHGGSVRLVAYSSSKTSKTQWRRIFWKNRELFEERLCELVRNYGHINDVTSPGTGIGNSNRTAGREEIGRELNVRWTAAKEKWMYVMCNIILFNERCLLLNVLHNLQTSFNVAAKLLPSVIFRSRICSKNWSFAGGFRRGHMTVWWLI